MNELKPMGMIKNYLLELLHLCSDQRFGQDAVEWAILTGKIKLSYDKEQDLRLIVGEPGKSETVQYSQIVESYRLMIHRQTENLLHSYQPFLAKAHCQMTCITYPARPLNGGRFGLVPKKPTYLWSPKFNGWRAVVHAPTGTIFNRRGEELSIAERFAEALENLSRSSIEWLDCEALERRHEIGRGSLVVLDAIVPKLNAGERYQLLIGEADGWQWPILGIEQRPEANEVYLCKQIAMSDSSHTGQPALTNWWGWMQRVNKQWGADFYEGFVAKRVDSLYPIQLRSPEAECSSWIKHRWAW